MTHDGLPYRDDDDTIVPDAMPKNEQPAPPAEALRRTQERYGETTADENRDDQWDVHHGKPDDIV